MIMKMNGEYWESDRKGWENSGSKIGRDIERSKQGTHYEVKRKK